MNLSNLIVYVVDDDAAMRESTASLLASRGYQVQLFDSGETFLAQADIRRCGVVILDRHMGPAALTGDQVFDELKRQASPLVVLFLSGHGNIAVAVDVTKRGAFNWLEKTLTGADQLLEATAAALVQAASIGDMQQARQKAAKLWDTLTPREMEVAREMRHGTRTKLIARKLVCGARAVETHRLRIRDKLNVGNPAELDRFMRDNDL
jgi:FixJ family two-component response regulator